MDVDFDIGDWILYRDYVGEAGNPSEAFLKCIAVKNGEKQIIDRAKDIHKIIKKIESKDAALALVRFFSSIETHYLFEDIDFLEVQAKDDKKSKLGFAQISINEYMKLKMKPLEIISNGDKYIIRRNICRYPSSNRPIQLIRSKEIVTSDGHYTIIYDDVIANGNKVDILLPFYE